MLTSAFHQGFVAVGAHSDTQWSLSAATFAGRFLLYFSLVTYAVSLKAESDNQPATQSPAKSAREVLFRVRDSFARIRSIHYTFDATQSTFRTDKPDQTTHTQAEFAFDAGKFYSSFEIRRPPSNRAKSERIAFDGSVLQRYDNDGLLIISADIPEMPYVALQPVIYPFLFARPRTGRLTFEEISNAESWNDISDRAKLEPSEVVNGYPCDVVSFGKQGANREVLKRIYAARDLEYYPLRETSVNGKYVSVTDVTEWKVVRSSTGDVVIPLKIISETRAEEGRLSQWKSFVVTLKSANVDLDDVLFSLKRFEPETTKYVDGSPNLRTDSERGRWTRFVLALNVGVVILLLIAVLIKRRKWNSKES